MLWLLILVAIIIGSIDLYFYQQIERFSLLLVSMPIILSFSFLNKRYGALATVLFYLTIAYAVIKFFLEQTLA
jgi:glucose-6-phosphate-specific signal transduction histidine kinase